MNRIRGGATTLGAALFFALLVAAQVARAQEVTGRVIGKVTDEAGAPLGGVTVIAQGPQGEDATLTDDKGDYLFTTLVPGTYVLRFYVANASSQVEQPNVAVIADRTVRANARIAGAVQAAAQQTYVITGKVPSIDVGDTRVGANFDRDYFQNIPTGRTFGDAISRAPGTFVDPTGNVSIGGSTGLENIYVINGINVTGMEMGNLESGGQSLGGGTNLPVEFLSQLDISSGGYQAEFGGAMGGVINTLLKSGSNEWHGSAFTYFSPYWLSANPNPVVLVGSSLGMMRKPDFDTTIGAEVGGPIIKDKLFFWAGFAPRFNNTHVFRLTYAQEEDPAMPGQAVLDPNGNPVVHEVTDWRARVNESRKSLAYAATMDFLPRPDHRLTLALFGTPSFNEQMRSVFGTALDAIANPAWMKENLSKTNTDVSLRYLGKFLDKRLILEGNLGYHREDFNDRSPDAARNALNQLEYWGTSLWDLEHATGCQPTASGFNPCPVGVNSNPYHTGGFGMAKEYTGQRWIAELKLTHLLDLGGHHEIKGGYRLESVGFDQDRYYSGPAGSRALVILAPTGNNGGPPAFQGVPYYSTYNFFTLQPGQSPSDFGPGGRPFTDFLRTPIYQDNLKASVSSLSNAFFLQDNYSPAKLRNLSINVGARLEMQRLTDTYDVNFLDTNNLGPRIGVVYDPFADGRSKISAAYGRYFEAIPMNMSARYFGGEGILTRNGVPLDTCANQDAYSWTGNGEWGNCSRPAVGSPNDPALSGTNPFNNGSSYPVQPGIKGQYHNEIVATLERELMEDLTLRVDYVHRWIGRIIEDGTTDPSGSFAFVLANPGDIPDSALESVRNEIDRLDKEDPTGMDARIQSELGAAQAKLANLEGLQKAPKPKRTYDGITLSLSKRFSKNFFARASYTYSRLVGNYQGLFQAEGFGYFAPNGSNAYDTPDLYLNQNGYLPNDRPHQGRVDGYYTYQVGKGTITFGLSFAARSGVPRNYISAWYFNQPQNMLLPRGSAGRTPAVSQFDAKLMYGRPVTPTMKLDGFIDFFNIFNQQAVLATDDVYTFDPAAAIVNGTKADLPFAKNIFGSPVTPNPNYGHAFAYQLPFNARLGLRLTF